MTRALLAAAFGLLCAACGFHLRGTGAGLPADLQTLQVTSPGRATNEPIVESVSRALQQSGATLTEASGPNLVVYDEHVETQVLSVQTATGKASEYMLRYSVSFRLDGAGAPVAPQTIRLQREYTFDPVLVLAKEQEERELLRDMREDAAQQIVRRLARIRR